MRLRTRKTCKNHRRNDWHFSQVASPDVGNFFLFPSSYIFIDLSIYPDILLNACIVIGSMGQDHKWKIVHKDNSQ